MTSAQAAREFQRAYERIADACIALDSNWRCRYVNGKAGELMGRDPESLLGKHFWTEFPVPGDDPFRCACATAMAEQKPITLESPIPGQNHWYENRIYPTADGVTICILDISERRRSARMEAGQHAILAGIATQQPLTRSLDQIARLHEALNPGALCSLLLADKEGKRLIHGAAPGLPDAYNQAVDGLPIADEIGSCATSAWRGERVVVEDIATHPYWAKVKDIALAHGLRACWSTPVFGSSRRILGTFAVYYRKPHGPRIEELESIDKILSITAIAIESDQLIRRLRERDYFFEKSTEIYCIFDTKSQRIIQSNPAFSRVTGYSAEKLSSHNYLSFVHPDDRHLASDLMAALNASKPVREIVYRFQCQNGSYRWLEWISTTGPGNLAFTVARDVTDRRDTEEALAYADAHDAVTGLPHRLVLEDEVTSLLEASRPVWVLLIGLDRFHTINESMGHSIGDDVLKCVAGRLRGVLRERDRIARFAGDQFVIAVPELQQSSVLKLVQRLRQAIGLPIDSDDYRLVLTASIGISHAPDHGHTAKDLLRRAEAAMNRAKRQGRDSVCKFSAQDMRDIEDRLLLGHRLRGAVERGEMQLHYQPQHAANGSVLTGFEALLRWTDPERGLISPSSFIPVAEALGLMPEIGQWVVDQACRQAREWLDRGHRGFTIAVNVSAQELQLHGLVASVGDALRRHKLPADILCMELTESSLMENVERAQSTLEDLKDLGTELALDDFGTGYSSLAYLKHFPIDKLKIDQSFVRGLPDGIDDAAIARTIVAMAHQLRMSVAAEGVETDHQARFLQEIGCDELQGYYLGRPVSATEAETLFAPVERRV